MPSFYRMHDIWYKECSDCGKTYTSHVTSNDAAYDAFRKYFSPRKNARDGLESGCYRCRAIATMRIKFGIDVETLLNEQNNECPICHTVIEFNTGLNASSACVDHDHITGETRGMLCRSCNLGLGHFKDEIGLLSTAIEYLMRWKNA